MSSELGQENSVIYRFLYVTADPNRLQIKKFGQVLDLEPKSLRVLFYLIEHRSRVVSKDELIEKLWSGVAASDNSLTRVIAQIRKQLGDNARSPTYIETVSTTGYRFIAPLDEATSRRVPRRGWLASLAAASAAIPIGAWWLTRSTTRPPARLSGLRQLTRSMFADLWPSFSPDGSQLVFTSNRTGPFQLYIRSRAPGGIDRQITFDDQEYLQPAWSPDGQYIAYLSRRRGGISLIPASGGVSRIFTDSGDSPAWSPDGKRIVFRRFSLNLNPAIETTGVPATTLWTVGLDGQPPLQLTQQNVPPGGHSDASWTSDSGAVIFTAGKQVWQMQFDARSAKELDGASFPAVSPRMSPDLKRLYFIATTGQNQGIYQAQMESGSHVKSAQIMLPSGAAIPRDLALSRDGRLLAFSQQIGDGAIWTLSLKPDGTPSGKPGPLIRDRSLRNSEPTYSPDGSRFAYTSLSQTGEVTILTAHSDGSEPTPVTTPDQSATRPSWIGPSTLAYRLPAANSFEYWVHPLAASPRRLDLKMDLAKVDRQRASHDGTRLAAHLRSPSGNRILVEDLSSHTVTELSPPSRNIGFPAWSPNGEWIAAQELHSGSASLVCLPSHGGPIETLETGLEQNFVFDWAPDSDRLLFAGLKNSIWDIYWISRSSHKLVQLTQFTNKAGFVRYPAWSPAGDRILFEYQHVWGNIFLANLES